MSDQARVGTTIRQSYAAFWKEWIILVIAAVLIGQPGMVTGWIEAKSGPGIFEGLPADMIIQGAGLLGVIYALIYKIGYDLLANRYTLNEEEVVEIYGIIQKNRRVTKLEHIRRVSVEIGVVGRILGYGDVLYFTAGSGGVDVRLKDIPNPEALAAEADALAKRKQEQVANGESGESGKGRGSRGAALAGGQILDALNQAIAESVTVQREIVDAVNQLRSETRRSTAVLQKALQERPAPTTNFAEEHQAVEPHVVESASDQKPEEDIPEPHQSKPEEDKPAPAWHYDDGDALPEIEESYADPEDEHYDSSPKMFDNWEDALAPSPRSEEGIEKEEVGDSAIAPEPAASESDHDSTSEPEAERDEEPQQPAEPEPTPRVRQKEQADVPAGDDEFVGLMAPGRK